VNLTREQFEELKKIPMFKSKVVSDSMVPLINIGDEVIIDVGHQDLKRFDIIVFYHDGKLISHYLWRINRIVKPILLQTRNMSGKLDYPIEQKDYFGKVMNFKLSFWQKLRILI
jgi:signal peptidase I